MNYYNPYYTMTPMTSAVRPGIFSALKGASNGGLTLGSIINGTQKTLGIVNQAIPIVKQVAPVMKNAKTMFRVMNEFKKVNAPSPSGKTNVNDMAGAYENVNSSEVSDYSDAGPTFFV